MDIRIYTDGACRGNGTVDNPIAGLGIVLLIPDKQPIFHCERLTFNPNTNNKAEIYAVIRSFKLLADYYDWNNKNEFKDNITIYSDSAYTINGITKWIDGWRANDWKNSKKEPVKNQDLWQELDRTIKDFENTFNIYFEKVEGHFGDCWNEKCDELANRAMDNKF